MGCKKIKIKQKIHEDSYYAIDVFLSGLTIRMLKEGKEGIDFYSKPVFDNAILAATLRNKEANLGMLGYHKKMVKTYFRHLVDCEKFDGSLAKLAASDSSPQTLSK